MIINNSKTISPFIGSTTPINRPHEIISNTYPTYVIYFKITPQTREPFYFTYKPDRKNQHIYMNLKSLQHIKYPRLFISI